MKTLKRSCVLAVAFSALLRAYASYAGYKSGGFRSRPSYSRPAYKSAPKTSQTAKQQAQKPKQQQPKVTKKTQVDKATAARRTAMYSNNGSNWLPWLAVGYMIGSSGSHAQTFATPIEVKDAEAKSCDVMPPLRCDWTDGT